MRKAVYLPLFLLLCGGIFFSFASKKCSASFENCPSVENTSQIAHNYFWYTQQNFEAVSLQEKKVVLFFYAPWCGTCSVLDQELIEHPERLGEEISVLKIAYDKDRYLKSRYSITTQHTLVYVDHNGNEIRKWVGGGIKELRDNVQR